MKSHIKNIFAITIFILILCICTNTYASKICSTGSISFYDYSSRAFNLKTMSGDNEYPTTYDDIGYNIIIKEGNNILTGFRNIPIDTEFYSQAVDIMDVAMNCEDISPYDYNKLSLKISAEETSDNQFLNVKFTIANKTDTALNEVALSVAGDMSVTETRSLDPIQVKVINDNSVLRYDPQNEQATTFILKDSEQITPVSTIWVGPFSADAHLHYMHYMFSNCQNDNITENDSGSYDDGCLIFTWSDLSIPANSEISRNFLVKNTVNHATILATDFAEYKIGQTSTSITGTISDLDSLDGITIKYSLDNGTPVDANAIIDKTTGKFSFNIPNLELKNYSLKIFAVAADLTQSAYVSVTLSPCKVTYKLPDGTILKEDYVFKGGTSVPPTNLEELGKEFTSWDKPTTNIQEDTVITAVLNTQFDGTVADSTGGTNILVQYATANERTGITCSAAPLRLDDLTPTQKSQLENLSKYRCYKIELKSLDQTYNPQSIVRVGIPIPPEFQNTNLVVYGISDTGTRTEYPVTVVNNYAYFLTTSLGIFALADLAPDLPANTEVATPNDGQISEGILNTIINGPATGDTIALFFSMLIACIAYFIYKSRLNVNVNTKAKKTNIINKIKDSNANKINTQKNSPSVIINENKRNIKDIESKYKDLL